MLRTIVFVLAVYPSLGGLTLAAEGRYRVIDRKESGEMASYQVVIPPGDFRKETLVRLANGYVHGNAELPLLDVRILTEVGAAHDFAGKGVTDITFEWWKHELEIWRSRKPFAGAEVVKVGKSAALRIRYPDGRIEEVSLRGESVFQPTVNGLKLKLLHVEIARQGFGRLSQLTPHLYFGLPRQITAKEASELARSLLRASGVPNAEICLGEDGWFIFDSHYPWVNPFAPVQAVPNEAQASRIVEFFCKPTQENGCYQLGRLDN